MLPGCLSSAFVADAIAYVWAKYLQFASYVVSIAGGVHSLCPENFQVAPTENYTPSELNTVR